MKNVLNFESQVYSIKSNDFEGPLDLLCHLIDKNKMDICDINISDITDQYIEYLNKMEELNLEIASEFVIMASTLLYLKSKTLLPNLHDDEKEEEELTEEELLKRIIEYKKYKEISSTFGKMYENNYRVFFKDEEKIKFNKKLLEEYDVDYMTIYDAYRKVVDKNKTRLNRNAKNIKKIAITDNYTVSSKVKEMYKELIKNKKFVFNNLYSQKQCNKEEVVTAFTGLLEMSRRSKVQTSQEMLFGDITVEKHKRKID